MMMITACATLGYTKFDLETALKQISARGFKKVEISEMGSYCSHFPYREADAAKVRELLEKHGLLAVSMNVSASSLVNGEVYRPSFSDPKDAEYIIECGRWFIESADKLGA